MSDGLCIQCKLPAIPRCHSDAGKREFAISGLCEICFDGMFEDEEDEPEVEVQKDALAKAVPVVPAARRAEDRIIEKESKC